MENSERIMMDHDLRMDARLRRRPLQTALHLEPHAEWPFFELEFVYSLSYDTMLISKRFVPLQRFSLQLILDVNVERERPFEYSRIDGALICTHLI